MSNQRTYFSADGSLIDRETVERLCIEYYGDRHTGKAMFDIVDQFNWHDEFARPGNIIENVILHPGISEVVKQLFEMLRRKGVHRIE